MHIKILKARGIPNKYHIQIVDLKPIFKTIQPMTHEEATGHIQRLHEGGKLSIEHFKKLLNASYLPNETVEGFVKDMELSTNTTVVFFNPETGQCVIAHRGTEGVKDMLNNVAYAVGGIHQYKKTKRYKNARTVQRQAEEKYGKENVTTIGHSQGALLAELLGHDTKEIITLNKATRPWSNTKQDNQFDITTSGDYVSKLNPFQEINKNEKQLKSKTWNPVKEHSTTALNRHDNDMIVGQGIMTHTHAINVIRKFYNHLMTHDTNNFNQMCLIQDPIAREAALQFKTIISLDLDAVNSLLIQNIPHLGATLKECINHFIDMQLQFR